jgi:hypothetical protein
MIRPVALSGSRQHGRLLISGVSHVRVSWEEKSSSWAPTFRQKLLMPIYVLPITISSWLRNIQVNTGSGEAGVSVETSSRLRVEFGKRSWSINSVEPGYLLVKAQNQRLPLSSSISRNRPPLHRLEYEGQYL